jgi:hypothetical protein
MPRRTRAITLSLALLAAATATAAAATAAPSITKNEIASVTIAPGATRTLSVPFPDALEYAGARYRGRHELAPKPGALGSSPQLSKVAILESQAVEGGSLYRVRARNTNAAGSAPVRLTVIATTIEPPRRH